MGLNDFTGPADDDKPDPNQSAPIGVLAPGPAASQAPGNDHPALDLLVDYNKKFTGALPTRFREDLIEQTLSILIGHEKPNPLLVGAAGVGKTRVVEDIARRIAEKDPLVPDQLHGYTVFELPITNIVAGSSMVGEIEAKAQAVIDYAGDPKNKVILFIDEIHQITGSTGSGTNNPSTQKISQILKPALARGEMSVIGATTSTESRGFDEDPAFARRFTRLVVDELTPGQTEEVLTSLRPRLLDHYRQQISVSDEALATTVRIADTSSRAGQHRPDNAITLLDRAMADRCLRQRRAIITAEEQGETILADALRAAVPTPLTSGHIEDVARRMVTGIATAPTPDLPALHRRLTDRLQGQSTVLATLVEHLQRRELDLLPSNRPTAWLLAGPSGVGKTETVKQIAQELTSSPPIMLNMAEYHARWSSSKIIGSPPGYIGSDSNQEMPFDTLESDPYRVILLDELEKAHTDVQRLFLSAFDEGFIRNAHGGVIDFSRTIIVATTNAARDSLSRASVGFAAVDAPPSAAELNRALEAHFEPELLGRFSLVAGFEPMTQETYREVLEADYLRLVEEITRARPRLASALPARLPGDVAAELTRSTFVPSLGARPAGRAVRRWVEDQLATPVIPADQTAYQPQPMGEIS